MWGRMPRTHRLWYLINRADAGRSLIGQNTRLKYPALGLLLLPWTDITCLLHKYGVSWRYYVFEGNEPDCEDDEAMTCAPVKQGSKTPGIWNPLVDGHLSLRRGRRHLGLRSV